MIRLLFIDADGTLVGRDRVHPRNWEALDRARRRGVRIALCTGRPGVAASLDLARRVDPDGVHIFQTGAVLSKPGEPAVRVRPLPREAFRELVEISRRTGEPLEAYGERRYFLESHSTLTRRHSEVLEWTPEVVDLLAIDEPIVRAQWVVRDAEWPRFRALTEPVAGLSIHTGTGPWAPGVRFANLIRSDTSKAEALLWLANHHGIPRAATAMVGDAENDADAMEASGLGIAMGNAPAPVQARAAFVVGDVEDGGLAEAVDRVLAFE